MSIDDRVTASDGVSIAYRDCGSDDPALVLLPDIGGNLEALDSPSTHRAVAGKRQATAMAEYALRQEDDPARERERLAKIQAYQDPPTVRFLEALGVTDGWHCLEAGAGWTFGSAARRASSPRRRAPPGPASAPSRRTSNGPSRPTHNGSSSTAPPR